MMMRPVLRTSGLQTTRNYGLSLSGYKARAWLMRSQWQLTVELTSDLQVNPRLFEDIFLEQLYIIPNISNYSCLAYTAKPTTSTFTQTRDKQPALHFSLALSSLQSDTNP